MTANTVIKRLGALGTYVLTVGAISIVVFLVVPWMYTRYHEAGFVEKNICSRLLVRFAAWCRGNVLVYFGLSLVGFWPFRWCVQKFEPLVVGVLGSMTGFIVLALLGFLMNLTRSGSGF